MSTPEPTPAPPPARTARRCNADYRWTVAKVETFLRVLGRCGKVAEAARAVGMTRQSVYRLKARLADPRFQQTFELARCRGLLAREEARRVLAAERQRQSEWGEPGLAAYDYLRGKDEAAQGDARLAQGDRGNAHGDGRHAQGDTRPAQGYASGPRGRGGAGQGDGWAAQGYASAAQGDGSGRKAPF